MVRAATGERDPRRASVSEGGWGRGRGESNGNAASGSRPRLSAPRRQRGMGVNTPRLH